MKKTVFCVPVALALMVAGCGQGVGDGTNSSGPSVTSTPVTQATATPAPTAAPTPSPSASATCLLPRLPNCDAQCCSEGGSVVYRSEIESAQSEMVRTEPSLFFSNGDVRDNIQYMNALAKQLISRSGGRICAEPLGHDEMRIKGDQNLSQHVDVLIADRTPWVGGAYTCRPASF